MKLKYLLLPVALWAILTPLFGDDVIQEHSQSKPENPVYAGIHLLARTYGDSVVLRWSGEDYVTQSMLDLEGVRIIRLDYDAKEGETFIDTLVSCLKPWTETQFQEHYPETDTVALMGCGMLYTTSGLKPDQTRSAPGTVGSLYEIYQDQQTQLAMRVLVSEWRSDVADHMAMRFVDHNVRAGRKYEYIVLPTVMDTTANVPIAPASKTVVNERYVKPKYDIQMGDSILDHCSVRLWWENKGISSYEIERRVKGDKEWTRINSLPYWYMAPMQNDDEELDCSYSDFVPAPGDYEYRVFGHDPFGELTSPSPILSVHVPDMAGPLAPNLVLVEVDRQDPTDLSKKVMATFHFEKDSLEDDFIGFMPLYYSNRGKSTELESLGLPDGKMWKKLSKELLPPDTKTFTCDMTGFSTGMVVVAAYDTAHNVSYSTPRMVQLVDVKAPSPMRNFRAEANVEDGTIKLTWEPDSIDDDIEYYELTYANDTTHSFMLLNQGKITECQYVDTVAMDVNQKYIYYKVRAIDYSTNQGEDTPALQVIRPSRLVPEVPHLLKSSVDSLGIHMEWACSNEQVLDHHVLLRRLEGEEKWDTLAVYNADSVKAADNSVIVLDKPYYDRQREYQYCMESVTCSGIRSGHSLLVCFLYEGPRFLNIPLKLQGRYDADADETVLTWEVNDGKPLVGDWYFSLYRKGPDDEYSKFYISLPADKRERHSSMLIPGQSESYYIKVVYDDGRKSYPSQSVTVTATKKEQ